MTTAHMHPDLAALLRRYGHTRLDTLPWGRRVAGNAHGVSLERHGHVRHYAAPLVTVTAAGQVAIVRFG